MPFASRTVAPSCLLLMAILLAVTPFGAAQGTLEIDILEGYLAAADRVPDLPHCGRHGGYVNVPGQDPLLLPTGGTNAIMTEHTAWHQQHGGARHVPSTDDEDRFGDLFLGWHREFLQRYEDWRAAAGYPPLAAWDPGTPMPPSLAYEFPGRGCTPGRDSDPGVALPTWATVQGGEEPDPLFGHTRLCDFQDTNQLGKSISVEYHVAFHAGVGGDMRVGHGPRDPAFWAGHRFIDGLGVQWETECAALAASVAEASPTAEGATARAVPGAGLGALLLGLSGAAMLAGKARRR